jgi:putative redox protein
MVSITMKYEGDLHCTAVHGPSGTELSTDAPRDNQGRGESFSPTDLVATALGTCVLTTMAIMARTLHVNIDGSTASVTKEMVSTPTRRIGRLAVTLHVPYAFSDDVRLKLERAAHTCPVHRSLHPDVDAPIVIEWGSASA